MKAKSTLVFLVVLIAIAMVATFLVAKDKKDKEMVTCPVSGEKLAKSDAKGPVNYDGKDYYFSCEKCQAKFLADPAKYASKAEQVSTLCCGGKTVDKASAVKASYKGKDYYFCGEKCQKTFQKDPEAYLKKVKAAKAHTGCPAAEACGVGCSSAKAKSCCGKK